MEQQKHCGTDTSVRVQLTVKVHTGDSDVRSRAIVPLATQTQDGRRTKVGFAQAGGSGCVCVRHIRRATHVGQ